MRISDWSSDVCSSDLQVNGALQWQATPSLEIYAEGFYTYFRDRGSRNGANIQPFTNGTTITDVTPGTSCINTYVRSNGNNPVIQTDVAGVNSWTLTPAQLANPVELCQPESMPSDNQTERTHCKERCSPEP